MSKSWKIIQVLGIVGITAFAVLDAIRGDWVWFWVNFAVLAVSAVVQMLPDGPKGGTLAPPTPVADTAYVKDISVGAPAPVLYRCGSADCPCQSSPEYRDRYK